MISLLWFQQLIRFYCSIPCVCVLADLPGFDATKITVFGAIAAIADRVARTPAGVSESEPPSIAVVLLGLAGCCETAC